MEQEKATYTPAAAAIKEAFDISAAVHRMGEESALLSRKRRNVNNGNNASTAAAFKQHRDAATNKKLDSLTEETITEEEYDKVQQIYRMQSSNREKETDSGRVIKGDGLFQTPDVSSLDTSTSTMASGSKPFDLNLKAATILGRRRKKEVMA